MSFSKGRKLQLLAISWQLSRPEVKQCMLFSSFILNQYFVCLLHMDIPWSRSFFLVVLVYHCTVVHHHEEGFLMFWLRLYFTVLWWHSLVRFIDNTWIFYPPMTFHLWCIEMIYIILFFTDRIFGKIYFSLKSGNFGILRPFGRSDEMLWSTFDALVLTP